MRDRDKLTILIERRKLQEKQNDRIRVHKNKLENMRLEQLSKFFDWSKNLLKQEHLTTEARCIKKLEKLYERQCQIEDKKKNIAAEKKKKEEESMKPAKTLYGMDENQNQEDETIGRNRRVVKSASQQEQAKNFTNKAKSLSSGYRDNDPPQSYYRRKGLVPPDRVVNPEVSYSLQAQQGGGFFVPPSALHVRNLKRWHGIPESATLHHNAPLEEEVKSESPPPEKRYNVFEALKALDDGLEGLEILQEEDESDESTPLSPLSDYSAPEIDEVSFVNVRPSTAPAQRTFPPRLLRSKNVEIPESGILTNPTDENTTDEPEIPVESGILLTKRPSTAAAGVTFTESKDKPSLLQRRQSSAISFSELPEGRRRSSSAVPLALLHRKQSNVAAIHKSIQESSKLLKPNKMKRKSGKRMGLVQSVMTNVENEILIRKLREKSECLAQERIRRLQQSRAQSAPSGSRQIQVEENYPTTRRLSMFQTENTNQNIKDRKKNHAQKHLIEANVEYSNKLDTRVKNFLRPQTAQ